MRHIEFERTKKGLLINLLQTQTYKKRERCLHSQSHKFINENKNGVHFTHKPMNIDTYINIIKREFVVKALNRKVQTHTGT